MELRTEEWKEFKIGDLFDSESGDTDIKQEDINNSGYPVITSGTENFGILGSSTIKAKLIDKNTITVDMFGNVYFRKFKYKMVTHARVFALIPKDYISPKSLLFISTSLSYLKEKFGYSHMCSFNKIKKEHILLPEKNDEPDWVFMEEYISFIEGRYIDRIEEKNKEKIRLAMEVTGITEEELDGELVVEEPERVEEFRVGDLFEIKPTKHYGLTNDELYSLNEINPVIANSSQKNGLTGYTEFDNTEKGNMITFSDTTDHNSIFYQPVDFVGYSHIQGLYPKKYKNMWNRQTHQYFLTVFKKTASGHGFSYGYKFSRKIASNFCIPLPALDEKTPDFEYMEKAIYIYIRAVIKDWKLAGEEKVRMLRKIILK